MSWRTKRELLFLTDKDYKRLRPEEVKLLKEFRRTRRYRDEHDRTTKDLRKQIKEKRKKMDEYDLRLGVLYNKLSPLIEKYYFTVSITSFKKGPNKTEYFNLCINRPGLNPKSISLGNLNSVKQHLRLSFPDDIDKINKNWKSFLKVDCSVGRTYDIIHNKIMLDPLNFDNTNTKKGGYKWTKFDFLPIRKPSKKK